jgi:signal transduction histidine kinase
MKFIGALFLVLFIPFDAWGYVPHEYPAIYPQQLGRIFLFVAFLLVLRSIVRNGLYKQKGWRYVFLSLIFFTVWDLDVFVGRLAEFIAVPRSIGAAEGWEYFKRSIEIGRFEYLYYIGRLDFALLNIAMLLFYTGLREHLREEKDIVPIDATIILPLLPVFITDVAGNCIFILLSVMSLHASVKLYRKDRENVLWNYMVWVAASWFIFSISRSFGHIVRHVLIPTGNEDVWKVFEPIAGSFNTFALFFVGSVSLFFVRIYESYMRIAAEKMKLEGLVAERTRFIEMLERDKTELKELDKLKSAFLANMSHELRTPMNSIIGYTELLLDGVDGPMNAEQQQSLRRVKGGANRLLRLIDDILSMSRLESAKTRLEIKEIDVKALIDSVVPAFDPLIKQKGLTLTIDLGGHLPSVYGDEDKIQQVLINLLSNAVKFTHQGGILITAGLSRRGYVSGEASSFLEVCVEDTGIGIREEDLKKVFGKFFQVDFSLVRRYEGAGIGLSVAKGLVEMHKGEIWATSKLGEGSRFCFTLPLRREILGLSI